MDVVGNAYELSSTGTGEFELSGFYCVYIYVISYPHGFLKAFVGTSSRGKVKIRQDYALDACKALPSLLYKNLCIFLIILCISSAIGLRELSAIKIFSTIPLP